MTRSRRRFLQTPRLIQTLTLIQRGPSTQCRDPVPPTQIYLDFWAPSPNSHRHSGLSPPGCSILGPLCSLQGCQCFSFPERARHRARERPEREAGERGRWNSRAPSQHHLTSLPELYQERGKPIYPCEVSLNSRGLEPRQLRPQPPLGSSGGVWGFALHHHVRPTSPAPYTGA